MITDMTSKALNWGCASATYCGSLSANYIAKFVFTFWIPSQEQETPFGMEEFKGA